MVTLCCQEMTGIVMAQYDGQQKILELMKEHLCLGENVREYGSKFLMLNGCKKASAGQISTIASANVMLMPYLLQNNS